MDIFADDRPETAAPNPRSKRRWLQFSLRTLLIAVTLLAVAVGMLMQHVNAQREIVKREQAAVLEIEKLGGGIGYDQSQPVLASLPAWIRSILGEEDYQPVKFVNLIGAQISDEGLHHLSQLTTLEELWLCKTQITDVNLRHLSQLTTLTYLDLNKTQITDAGLQHLSQLTNLKFLYLQNTQITEAGYKKLKTTLLKCNISW